MAHQFPDFLYIGASKAGSSWLFECLKEHPKVFVPTAKDIQYFDRFYDKGHDWYASFFKNKQEFGISGELSHDYFLFEGCAEKIYHLIPKVQLIVCLREPLDKLKSGYEYAKRTYLDQGVSFEAFFDQDEQLALNDRHNMGKKSAAYYDNLLPFYKLFPKEQILVLFYDDLSHDPEKFIRRVYEFLGVDVDFKPQVLHQKVNVSQGARNEGMAQTAYAIAGLLRKLGLANLVGSVKRHPMVERFLYKAEEKNGAISKELADRVRAYYRKDYGRLEELIGRELPEGW